MNIVTKHWNHAHTEPGRRSVIEQISNAIAAGAALGLGYVSLDMEHNDHFMNGGNVVKSECSNYTLVMSDEITDRPRP